MAPISKKLLIALGAAAIVVALAIVGLAVWYIKFRKTSPPPSSGGGDGGGGTSNGGDGSSNTPTPTMTYANGAWSGSFQITTDGPSYTIWDYTAAPNGNLQDMLLINKTSFGNGHVVTAADLNNVAAPGVKPGDILTTEACVPATGPIPASFSTLHISNADPTCPTFIWA